MEILLFHYRGATATAYYSAAYRVLDVLQILPVTVSGVLLPFLAGATSLLAAGRRPTRRAFELAVMILLTVAVPAAVFGGSSRPASSHSCTATTYHRFGLLLQILLPAFIPICLGYVLTSQLAGSGPAASVHRRSPSSAPSVNVAVNAIGHPDRGAPVAAGRPW